MNDDTSPQPGSTVAKKSKNKLTVTCTKDESDEAIQARMAYDPLFRSLSTTAACGSAAGEVDLTASMTVLREEVKKVKQNNLQTLECTLSIQANTLDAIFNELARRAMAKSQYLSATEAYLRLALKTQNQCRATIQTLANMKRPSTVIAQQANVCAGMQQVNNQTTTTQQPAPKKKMAS